MKLLKRGWLVVGCEGIRAKVRWEVVMKWKVK